MASLVFISGPSATGKYLLIHALRRYAQEQGKYVHELKLHIMTSRPRRPGENSGGWVTFRRAEELRALKRDPGYIVYRTGTNTLDAIRLQELIEMTDRHDMRGIIKVRPSLGARLSMVAAEFRSRFKTVFISPFNEKQITNFMIEGGISAVRKSVMDRTRKLLESEEHHRGADMAVPKILDKIRRNANRAYWDIQYAPWYDHILISRDGPASRNWEDPVSGDAKATMENIFAILDGHLPRSEQWPRQGWLPVPEELNK